MWFWVFMLIMELLLPFTMVGLGKHFLKTAPKEINMIFGYRTTMSMKNKDTWEFAHKYFGKIWLISGLVLLPVSMIVMILVIGKSDDFISVVGIILSVIQLIPLIGSIIPTEKALRKTFDQNGTRR